MHEYSLHAQIPPTSHHKVLQQLAGLTRMQPRNFDEIHLIFRARLPAGLAQVQNATPSSAITSTDSRAQEFKRVKTQLEGPLYHIQLVGEISSSNSAEDKITWHLLFTDTPDAGKQSTTSRLKVKIPVSSGNLSTFISNLGFDYHSRHIISGQKFNYNSILITIQRVHLVRSVTNAQDAINELDKFRTPEKLKLLDDSGSYVVQASIDTVDGSQELKDRANRELLALREILRNSEIQLEMVERLSLDTKVNVAALRAAQG